MDEASFKPLVLGSTYQMLHLEQLVKPWRKIPATKKEQRVGVWVSAREQQ